MDSEPEFKATPAEIARITRTALSALAEDHVILTKPELSELVDEAVQTTMNDMWDMTLAAYDRAAVQMAEVLSTERLRGFQLGAMLLNRMREAVIEEYSATFSAKTPENSPK